MDNFGQIAKDPFSFEAEGVLCKEPKDQAITEQRYSRG